MFICTKTKKKQTNDTEDLPLAMNAINKNQDDSSSLYIPLVIRLEQKEKLDLFTLVTRLCLKNEQFSFVWRNTFLFISEFSVGNESELSQFFQPKNFPVIQLDWKFPIKRISKRHVNIPGGYYWIHFEKKMSYEHMSERSVLLN